MSNGEDVTIWLCELQDVESDYLYSSQIKVTNEKNVVGWARSMHMIIEKRLTTWIYEITLGM